MYQTLVSFLCYFLFFIILEGGWCEGGLRQQKNDGGGCEKDRKEWRSLVCMKLNEFHAVLYAWPSVLSDRLPCSGGYHVERGGMLLYDAVGINCKKGTTSENQGIYGLRGVS